MVRCTKSCRVRAVRGCQKSSSASSSPLDHASDHVGREARPDRNRLARTTRRIGGRLPPNLRAQTAWARANSLLLSCSAVGASIAHRAAPVPGGCAGCRNAPRARDARFDEPFVAQWYWAASSRAVRRLRRDRRRLALVGFPWAFHAHGLRLRWRAPPRSASNLRRNSVGLLFPAGPAMQARAFSDGGGVATGCSAACGDSAGFGRRQQRGCPPIHAPCSRSRRRCRVLAQELAGVVLALADLLTVVGVPGTALLEDAGI